MPRWPTLFCSLLGASGIAWGAVTTVPPGPDHQVVEVLPQITTLRPAPRTTATLNRPPEPSLAARQAREAIDTARRTGDARFWGRAQTALGTWWDHPQAPTELMVLQATVLQGQHVFGAAQARLRDALKRDDRHAQAWLTLATLLKLDGQYAQALSACERVADAGATLYASACAIEIRSLQGAAPDTAWPSLLAQAPDDNTASWLLSLWGEHLERQGRAADALARYRQSLGLQPDLYTTLALADLLLQQKRAAQALVVLRDAPETDAVLLRRAHAQRLSNQPDWQATLVDLRARQQALERRGETLDAHARELGLMALWLEDDSALAWRWAQRNLRLQQEPVDWWLALTSARRSGERTAFDQLVQRVRALGLRDARLPLVWSDAS